MLFENRKIGLSSSIISRQIFGGSITFNQIIKIYEKQRFSEGKSHFRR